MHIVVVIPAYNEEKTVRAIVQRVLTHCAHVVVVNDGSQDATAKTLEGLPIVVLHNENNSGKAYSLWKGMQKAMAEGATAVLTLDADGQHRPEDIPRFLDMVKHYPDNIITGSRLADKAAFPPKRYYANKVANFWISWAAGYPIEDSQCGFRAYPTQLLQQLNPDVSRSRSFVFESEILIQAARLGFFPRAIPIAAIYEANARPSHFRSVWDIVLIVRMVAWKLISRGMYPQGLWRGVIAQHKTKNK